MRGLEGEFLSVILEGVQAGEKVDDLLFFPLVLWEVGSREVCGTVQEAAGFKSGNENACCCGTWTGT
jgi:hypothetical protein